MILFGTMTCRQGIACRIRLKKHQASFFHMHHPYENSAYIHSSSLDPFNLQVLTPDQLQRQFRLTILHNLLEPGPYLGIGLVAMDPHGLTPVPSEDGHKHTHELDLAHLHPGARPRATRPDQERTAWGRFQVQNRRVAVAGLHACIDQPSRWSEFLRIRTPGSSV